VKCATMQDARARLAAAAAPAQPQTIAAQWLAHAAQTLPRDASAEQVRRAERAFYSDRFDELARAPKTPENLALMEECRGWARVYIGRAA
jgi:hypothetical protein